MCCSAKISLVDVHHLIIDNSKISYRLLFFASGGMDGAITVFPLPVCIALTTLHPTLDSTKDINAAGSIGVGVQGVAHLSSPNL